jgi:hypothetical protein
MDLNEYFEKHKGPGLHRHLSPCFDRNYSSAKQGCYHIALADKNRRKRLRSLEETELSEQARLAVPYKYSNRPSQSLRG